MLNLQKTLSEASADLTPQELKKFRLALEKLLPGVIQTAKNAALQERSTEVERITIHETTHQPKITILKTK
jgi:hypothetical protein